MSVETILLGALQAVGNALVAFVREHDHSPDAPPKDRPSDFRPGAAASRVAAQAYHELDTWALRAETDPGVREMLEFYWKLVLAGKHPAKEFGEGWETSIAWSAAFVSWVVHAAHPGALLPSRAHWGYARDALNNDKPGHYKAYAPEDVKVKPGDIVIRTRSGSADRFSFADLQRFGHKPSHGDIVTEVKWAGALTATPAAYVIGGNLDNTVNMQTYALTLEGTVNDPRVIAVLTRNPD